MEHRLATRVPHVMPIEVKHRGERLLWGVSINVCRDGLLIDTGEMCLPSNALVEIEAMVPGAQAPCSAWAMVMHSRPGRAGVYVDDDATSLREHLAGVTISTPAPARAAYR